MFCHATHQKAGEGHEHKKHEVWKLHTTQDTLVVVEVEKVVSNISVNLHKDVEVYEMRD